jgi:DNA-binding XRE family transcriptional regulator
MMAKSPAQKLADEKRARARENRHTAPRMLGKVFCRVRITREKLGLSLHDVCRAVKISPAGLSAIERGGDVQMTTAHKLCRFFDLPVDKLWPVTITTGEP